MIPDVDAVIIGGGPSGSSAAISLATKGWNVAVLEKRQFPRNVVCGEFLSPEVITAIQSFGLYDDFIGRTPISISQFKFCPDNGIEVSRPFPFAAYTMKRSELDQMLLRAASDRGAQIIQPADVRRLKRTGNIFEVSYVSNAEEQILTASKVILAHGRQGSIDKQLKRSYTDLQSGINGVKYHIPKDLLNGWNDNVTALFSTHGIYCGINSVDSSFATLCFLFDTTKDVLDSKDALTKLLSNNQKFHSVFTRDLLHSLRDIPVTGTGNVYFGKRNVYEHGVFMVGDAAGVIAPLAGDGIGIAMESGIALAKILVHYGPKSTDEANAAAEYKKMWRALFSKRIAASSLLQSALLHSRLGNLGGRVLHSFPSITNRLLHLTRA